MNTEQQLFSATYVHLTAIRHISTMPGSGSQSQLYECSNSGQYVLKLIDNPQGTKSLATEYIAARLAEIVGLPVPDFAIVDVDQAVLPLNSNLKAGPAWGSRQHTVAQNFIPGMFTSYRDESVIPLLIAFDYWTYNWDRHSHASNLMTVTTHEGTSLLVIDHSICFCGPFQHQWTVESMKSNRDVVNYAYQGDVYNDLKQFVSGADPFRPAIEKIQSVSETDIRRIVSEVPDEWGLTADETSMFPEFLVYRGIQLETVLSNQKVYFSKWT